MRPHAFASLNSPTLRHFLLELVTVLLNFIVCN